MPDEVGSSSFCGWIFRLPLFFFFAFGGVSLGCIYKFCCLLFREFTSVASAGLPPLKGSVCFRTCYAVYGAVVKTKAPQSDLLGFSCFALGFGFYPRLLG